MNGFKRRYLGVLIGAVLLFSTNACGGLSPSELEAVAATGVAQTAAAFSPTPSPTRTPTPTPTETKIPTPTVNRAATSSARSKTQTAEADDCIPWDQVDDSMMGRMGLCVYGRIIKLQETERYPQIVRFSNEAGTFMLWSEWFTYLGLQPGMCVAAVGFLNRQGGMIGMEIGITQLYEYDGCE